MSNNSSIINTAATTFRLTTYNETEADADTESSISQLLVTGKHSDIVKLGTELLLQHFAVHILAQPSSANFATRLEKHAKYTSCEAGVGASSVNYKSGGSNSTDDVINSPIYSLSSIITSPDENAESSPISSLKDLLFNSTENVELGKNHLKLHQLSGVEVEEEVKKEKEKEKDKEKSEIKECHFPRIYTNWEDPIQTEKELLQLEKDIREQARQRFSGKKYEHTSKVDRINPTTCILKLILNKCWLDDDVECYYPHKCIEIHSGASFNKICHMNETNSAKKHNIRNILNSSSLSSKTVLVPIGYKAYIPNKDTSRIYFTANTGFRYAFALETSIDEKGMQSSGMVHDVQNDNIITLSDFLKNVNPNINPTTISSALLDAITKTYHTLTYDSYLKQINGKYYNCNMGLAQ